MQLRPVPVAAGDVLRHRDAGQLDDAAFDGVAPHGFFFELRRDFVAETWGNLTLYLVIYEYALILPRRV